MSESSGSGPEMDALRQQAQAAMEAHGISVMEAAKQVDWGYSTLQAFLKGSYKGDNAAVAKSLRQWLATLAAIADRRALIPPPPAFVETPTAAAFLQALAHAQTMPDIATVSGGAGVGKTLSAREYARNHPNVWIFTARPSISSTPAMLEALCNTIGVREAITSRRSMAIVRRVAGTGGLIIADEANHLSTPAIDELRSIHDEAQIGLVLMGNEEVYSRLDGGGRRAEFAQLFSRVGLRLRRLKPLAGDIDALLDAAGIEGTQERKLMRVIAGKPGALRGAAKCLAMARMLAAQDGTPIGVAHISQAWARLSDSAPIGEAQ
jgi:DNA transposition AAA+ family ATPase